MFVYLLPKQVYQAFNFIAWTQPTVEPVILIFFDRNLNLLARFMYCDRDQYTASQIAYLMAQNRMRQQNHQQQQPLQCNHDDDVELSLGDDMGGATPLGAIGGGDPASTKSSNPHNLSMEIEDAFYTAAANASGTNSSSRGDSGSTLMASMVEPICRRCSPRVASSLSPGEDEYSAHCSHGYPQGGPPHMTTSRSMGHGHHNTRSPRDINPTCSVPGGGFHHFLPVKAGRSQTSLEMTMSGYDPVRLKNMDEDDVQC